MLRIKKSRMLLIASVLGHSFCLLAVDAYDKVTDLALSLWTQVDLVRSINTTQSEKESFLEEIVQEALHLYGQAVNRSLSTKDIAPDTRLALVTLLTDICTHVKEVFAEISHPALSTTVYVLELVSEEFKNPS